MGQKDILSLTDAATMDANINSLMDCKLLSEEDVEALCKKVGQFGGISPAGEGPRDLSRAKRCPLVLVVPKPHSRN